MYDQLKTYCSSLVPLSTEELELIDKYFEVVRLDKKDYLIQDGKLCNFVGFIANGTIRHFHIINGIENTGDISFENAWVTDFQSFTKNTPGIMNLQAMEDSTVFIINKTKLHTLYNECSKYESFGRIMADNAAKRVTELALSISADKPEERLQHLIKKHPDLLQRIPQKYIANFLGISPEKLSRILSKLNSE